MSAFCQYEVRLNKFDSRCWMEQNAENQQFICCIFMVGTILTVTRFVSYIALFGVKKLKIAPFWRGDLADSQCYLSVGVARPSTISSPIMLSYPRRQGKSWIHLVRRSWAVHLFLPDHKRQSRRFPRLLPRRQDRDSGTGVPNPVRLAWVQRWSSATLCGRG